MAKMKSNNDERSRELVANCDWSLDVVANCDHIEKEENNISQSEIEKLILTIRGEQVIIDQDVARLYNVTTKRLNQQANRNSARFPHNFRFVLTK
ncbi:MAG: ORF6N domain-containing protein, partial [Bacteroidales bacterium]|nr:ORF6N domain-containing protein [Bacteroidales bacterium]